MSDEADVSGTEEKELFPVTAGERLRTARAVQKLELSDIASRTRVPIRHLEAIEKNDFAALPTPTYAIGFARAYARAVDEDEVEIARMVREQTEGTARAPVEFTALEPDEPARGPSRMFLFALLAAALLVTIFVGLVYGTNLVNGDGSEPATPTEAAAPATPDAAPAAVAGTPAPPPANGQVTLVANEEVWVRVYDGDDKTLLMKTLAKGERYDVPGDAKGPMINIGKPDMVQVLVNGQPVPPLGDGKRAIKVPISAAALAARPSATPAGTNASPPGG